MSLADPWARRTIFIAIAVLLAVAIGIAVFMVPRRPSPAPDFAWLTKGMQDCDESAAKQPGALYFLIIPMAVKPEDEQRWRSKSHDEIGNAILLNSDDALDGLKSGALRISAENYEFNVRDGAGVLYNWNSSVGVTRLTIPNAESIAAFNAQFKTRGRTSDTAWGSAFTRQSGNCYWVNAIIGN
jgi:hypothetical protein